MVRLVLVGVALFESLGCCFADRASPCAIRILPCQTIMFPWRADDSLCVLIHGRIIVLFLGVFFLCFDKAVAHLDRVEFIGADAPAQNLIAAGLGVEVPLSLIFDDRNRNRKIIVTDRKD